MIERFSDLELESARDLLWSDVDPLSSDYRDALATIVAAVESGRFEFAETVAETLALPGPNHDARAAYKFYFLAYAVDGFSVAFDNQSVDPTGYLGPIGDFRNEAMVSDLVQELGLAALPDLDAAASTLLATVV